jgi:hypothetical protein
MEPLDQNINPGNLELIRDSWEAYKSFRVVRNLFFWLILIGLLFIQAGFWAVHLGYAGSPQDIENTGRIISWQEQDPPPLVTTPPDQEDMQKQAALRDRIYKVLKIVNYVLPFSVVIYCLVMLFGFKLALLGRLGGIAESGRAFLLSLLLMVLVVPWYETINAALPGTLFDYDELIMKYLSYAQINDWWGYSAYYGRFVGFWGLAFLMLLLAQCRSFQAVRKIKKNLLHFQQDNPASIVAAAAEARRSTNTLEELGEKLAELGGDHDG